LIPAPVLLVLVAIEGWSENGAEWNYALLRKVLESIPGVVVVVPSYLDAKGILSQFRSHLTVEQYAVSVEAAYRKAQKDYPNALILVMGHSLGGIIARYLCKTRLFQAKNMILVGTPNHGIDFGLVLNGFLKFLANKRLCNVPVFNQLLMGSEFLRKLNKCGVPPAACYIRGAKDNIVAPWSSDPLSQAIVVDCDHKLFPRERKMMESSAIPVVEKIVKKRLAELASS